MGLTGLGGCGFSARVAVKLARMLVIHFKGCILKNTSQTRVRMINLFDLFLTYLIQV